MPHPSNFAFLNRKASEVAPLLLGSVLERTVDGQLLSGRIVEVEAYDQSDVASHSYNGETPRTKVMFGPAGYLYVYFTYGMHYCCNVVVGEAGHGAAVLIRAIEPLQGEATMQAYRKKSGINITNGPAKLCQALSINQAMNGHNLSEAPLRLLPQSLRENEQIVQTTRIGITKAKDTLWRFYIADNPFVSQDR